LKRFILVKRLNASKSKEEFAYYQKLIQEMYRTHKNTVNAFEEESTIEFLQSHLRDVESISAETRQQHHKLMQHKLALENDC
jgi:hypothetical protein